MSKSSPSVLHAWRSLRATGALRFARGRALTWRHTAAPAVAAPPPHTTWASSCAACSLTIPAASQVHGENGHLDDRELVLDFLALHEYFVEPAHAGARPPTLPRSVVHLDLNDNNVVCAEGRVSGVIDFGDMCRTETVNNLAVALACAAVRPPAVARRNRPPQSLAAVARRTARHAMPPHAGHCTPCHAACVACG